MADACCREVNLGRLVAKGLVEVRPGCARSARLAEAGQRQAEQLTYRRGAPPRSEGLAAPQAVMQLLGAHARSVSIQKGGFLWQKGSPADRLVVVANEVVQP